MHQSRLKHFFPAHGQLRPEIYSPLIFRGANDKGPVIRCSMKVD